MNNHGKQFYENDKKCWFHLVDCCYLPKPWGHCYFPHRHSELLEIYIHTFWMSFIKLSSSRSGINYNPFLEGFWFASKSYSFCLKNNSRHACWQSTLSQHSVQLWDKWPPPTLRSQALAPMTAGPSLSDSDLGVSEPSLGYSWFSPQQQTKNLTW